MKKVLVIEDNADNLFLITRALQRAGYEVLAAGTGEEGIEIAVRERPYFILMDIKLPGIDGLEATRRIRAATAAATVPIIALTSYALRGDMARVRDAGCTGYFEKPIDPLTIVAQIVEIVEAGRGDPSPCPLPAARGEG